MNFHNLPLEILWSLDLGADQQVWKRFCSGSTAAVMEIELEHWHHQTNNFFCIVGEAVLQFTRIAHQHFARGCLVLQSCRSYAEVLLVRQVDKLPIRITFER